MTTVTLQRGPAPIAQVPVITNIREVTRADLTHLTATNSTVDRPKTLRDNHHRVARAVASGLSNTEISQTCGISATRISTLKGDPAFQDLVAHYRSMLSIEWAKEADPVTELLRSNAMKAQAMLSDKLDAAAESEEFLPTRDLLGIAELGLDRTGYGKVSKNLNVNVDFAAKLEEARNRSSRAREPKTIEASVAPPLSPRSAEGSVPNSTPRPPILRRL